MTVLTLLRSELRRLTATRLGTVAFVALLAVPLLYGGLYLWGNQDPYGNLKHVPAALVVEDTGATVDGSPVHYGRDVADELRTSGGFDWHRMSANAAAAQLRTGGVDFVVTLPASFSADLASAATAHPARARVELTTSDANSYLSSTIAGQAATAIRTGVAQKVGTAAAKQFLVGLATVRGDLKQAAAGSDDLASGAGKAASGAASLAAGLSSAESGSRTLATGAGSAASGAADLASGARSLAAGATRLDDGLGALRRSTAELSASAASLATGARRTATGASDVADGSGALASALHRLDAGSAATADALRARLAADGLTPAQIADALAVLTPGAAAVHDASSSAASLASGASDVASGSARVANGAEHLSAAALALRDGVASAATGADSLTSGAGALASGADRLATGTRSVAAGASSLARGVASADRGAATLASGTGDVAAGAARLHDGLASGATRIPATSASSRSAEAGAIGDPAAVATTKATNAGGYGAGLAPFFLSLSAWIGSYALFLILRPLSRRAITAVRAPLRVALAGWLTPALLGAAQMVGLYLIVTGPLGFAVASPLATIGLLALTAATFAAILLLLNAALGSVGQFLGLILMLVQLVTAGGTFPWQTLPAPLAALHHALPRSYAVDALRQAMYGGDTALAWGDAGVLTVWLVAAVALTTAVAARMTRHRTLRDLQPSLLGG
ncbi:MAG: YhgE/Pip family protein [Amnibacterium sp.]